jgi:hypothetical protein
MTELDVKLILANPFYCLRVVAPVFAMEHEPLMTEEKFIKAGVQLIKEVGAAEYIRLVLENLKTGGPRA